MPEIQVQLVQTGPTTTEARIRDHRVAIDRPEAKGGADAGPMGGELLLASLGGCFASNLLAAINAREADVRGVRIAVRGELGGTPARFEAIRMEVEAERADPALLERLVTIAERGCIVANTLRGAVELTVVSAVTG